MFSYEIFYSVLYWSKFDMTLYAALNFTYLLPLSLNGPLFYFYLRQLIEPKKLSFYDFLHFLPFTLIMGMNIRFYVLPIKNKINALVNNDYSDFIIPFKWDYLLIVMLLFGYGLLVALKFRSKYKDDIEMSLWIRILISSFFTYTFVHVIYCIISYLNLELNSNLTDYLITIILILTVGVSTYFVHMHPSVFNGTSFKKFVPFVKYEKTGLSKQFSLELKEKLDLIMHSQKPFLNPDINLDTIANMLDVSRNHASQIVNEHYLMNFYDFINDYRIIEAKKILVSKRNKYSISEIAYQCGFNNRISFYNAFKKFVGSTPKEYQKQNTL